MTGALAADGFPVDDPRRAQPPLDHRPADRFVIGLDPGQSVDPTAIAAVREENSVIHVGHLERLPLGTTYPQVINHLIALMARAPFAHHSKLVLDLTGVGRPVGDMFAEFGVRPINVIITGGDTASEEDGIYRVPKLHLVSRVQALLHSGRLKIQATLPEAPILKSELHDFQAHVNEQGRWRFGARIGRHDDLVLAVALACWWAASHRALKIPPSVLSWARNIDAERRDRAGLPPAPYGGPPISW